MPSKKNSYLFSRPFPAYKDKEKEPYIFVSYSHADCKEVYADIKELHESGYRIWYDEGIARGQLLDDTIAEAIVGCQFFIAFLSPDAVDSKYVREEIYLALNEEKQFLPIHLKKTDLPPAMKLRLGPKLALKKFEYGEDLEDYYLEVNKALPSSLKRELGPSLDPLERDFEREIDYRIKKAIEQGTTLSKETAKEELLQFADLLGLPQETALRVIDRKIPEIEKYSERLETLRKMVVLFLNDGEIPDTRRTILANKARALEIRPEDWEKLVQQEAVFKAKDVLRNGDVELARRILISSVGSQVPQLEEVRTLLEQLEGKREEPPEEEGARSPEIQVGEPQVAAPAPTEDHAVTEIAKDSLIFWTRIPAGLFLRGCPDEFIREINKRFPNLNASVMRTYPVRKEPLDEFWMSVHPITNAQYHAFVRATGHRYPAGWRGTAPPYPKSDPNKPVTGVTWQDSLDFAEWFGARLPKRAEYEKACRGEEGRVYPWGNAFDIDKCNTAESKIDQTTAVDAYPSGASVYGTLDLVGNVWEWTADEKEGLRMTVGGSYEYTCEIYGAGFFDMSRPPESSGKDLGFRVACSDIRALKVEGLNFS